MERWKALFLLTIVFILASCGKDSRKLTIASKNFTEGIILSYIIAEMVKGNSDIEVDLKPCMSSSFVVWQALKSGDIDLCPEYTGTIYQAYLKNTGKLSADETLRVVRQQIKDKYNMEVFAPLGLNNTYALCMLRNRAEELEINKISDLREHLDLVAGFDNEFVGRPGDGAEPLFAAYGFRPQQPVLQLDAGLKYKAIMAGHADYTDAYSTDAKIQHFDLRLLEDDGDFFPPYYAVPLAQGDILERFPELDGLLAQLTNIISNEEMIAMNYDVEENKLKPQEVAINFLKSKNLIR